MLKFIFILIFRWGVENHEKILSEIRYGPNFEILPATMELVESLTQCEKMSAGKGKGPQLKLGTQPGKIYTLNPAGSIRSIQGWAWDGTISPKDLCPRDLSRKALINMIKLKSTWIDDPRPIPNPSSLFGSQAKVKF